MRISVDVGIIDGGVDFDHESIKSHYETGISFKPENEKDQFDKDYIQHRSWNFESDKYQQFDEEFYHSLSQANKANYEYYFGHGTAVANIIVTCVEAAKILSLKMPFDFLVEEHQVCRDQVPIAELKEKAIKRTEHRRLLFQKMKQFILTHRIPVVNCSWTEAFSDKLAEIKSYYPFLMGSDLHEIARIHFDGIISVLEEFFGSPEFKETTLFIIAAGNQHSSLDDVPVYPGVIKGENIITVGGTTWSKKWWYDRADYGSNYSPYYIDVCTLAKSFRVPWGRDVVKTKSGTSLATPLITGLCLDLLGSYPALKPAELKTEAINRCETVDSLKDKVRNGLFFDAYKHFPQVGSIVGRE